MNVETKQLFKYGKIGTVTNTTDAYNGVFQNIVDCVVLISAIDKLYGAITGEEMEAVQHAVAKRRREFTTGRILARRALASLGFNAVSLPVSEQRFPIWPSGIVGSISHTDNMAGVAVALSKAYSGIGFDIAVGESVQPDLYGMILDDKEVSQVKSNAVPDLATLIFSCKESVYKSVFPQFEEALDFQDVRIDISDGRFAAVCHKDGRSASAIAVGHGYFENCGGVIRTLFLNETK